MHGVSSGKRIRRHGKKQKDLFWNWYHGDKPNKKKKKKSGKSASEANEQSRKAGQDKIINN